MKVAIVGSRRFSNKRAVEELVQGLPEDATVVSGGCKGVDTWAVNEAQKRDLETEVIYPNLTRCEKYYDYVKAYYARNFKVAQAVDVMMAFPAANRKGGTENAINWMKQLGKPVYVFVPAEGGGNFVSL